MIRRGGIPAAVLIAWLMPGSLAAAPRAKPSPVAQEAASHLKRGTSLFNDARFDEALVEFRAAQRAVPSWEVLYEIGRCERRLNKFDDAVKDLGAYLSRGGAQVPSDRRAVAAKELSEIKASTAEVTISVRGEPASVTIDGEAVGSSPFSGPFLLGPGKKVFSAVREGQPPATRTEELLAGTTITVVLIPSAEAPPITLALDSTPTGAVLTVDGKLAGATPLSLKVASGVHVISAEASGYRPLQQAVSVAEGQKNALHLELEREPAAPRSRFPLVGTLVGGLGLVAIGGGVALSISARSRAGEVNGLFAAGGRWDAYYDAVQARGRREEGWSLAAGLGGGAALLTGVILVLVSLASEPSEGEDEAAPNEGTEDAATPGENSRIFLVPVSDGGLYCGLSFSW